MKSSYKGWTTIVFWIMVLCILIVTFGRSIPIYFVNPKMAEYFSRGLTYLTLGSIAITTYTNLYNREKNNWILSGSISMIVTLFAWIVIGFITFFDGFSSFTDVEILYVKGSDPDTRIIKQYVDSGALGEGYRVVTRSDITSFLKYEEFIDTNTINKKDWIKQKSYHP